MKSLENTAAAYLRMSTDHQDYSIANQANAIEVYADKHNIKIIRRYEDAGKSGLRIDGRHALKQLITDVQSGTVEFSTILVLDVSRWGRFQDTDESAYYEFICRHSGINVVYVGEQFTNDNSPMSSIIKSIKRIMAAEYSRELSAKVTIGQTRLIKMGFKQGGLAGYGLRRVEVDSNRNFKRILEVGERKSLPTHRVIYALGPDKEVKNVRWIYNMYTKNKWGHKKIARHLNDRGILNHLGKVWSSNSIKEILTNEKYIGTLLYNRFISKLLSPRGKTHPDTWLRVENNFEGLVPASQFHYAQALLGMRAFKPYLLSDEDLIGKLRDLYRRKKTLSRDLINEDKSLPNADYFRKRFGSMYKAYKLVGFDSLHLRFRDLSDEDMIVKLQKLYQQKGRLNVSLIKQTKSLPTPYSYLKRFGSLEKAYELAGFKIKVSNYKLARLKVEEDRLRRKKRREDLLIS